MYTIILSDGTRLTNLSLNGNNFVSKTEVTEDTFKGKLSKVTINYIPANDAEQSEEGLHFEPDSDIVGEHGLMELIQVKKYGEEWYFILRDVEITAFEKLQADVEYLLMMQEEE